MFELRWEENAAVDLVGLWTQAESHRKELISLAINDLQDRLRLDPHGNSESRTGTDRIVFAAPLGAMIQIDDAAATVSILAIWLFQYHD